MKKEFNGFSLIEMIVSVTIILILTGIGMANFSNLTKSKDLKTATNEISAWLTDARNLAITNQLPDKTLGLKFVKVTVTGSGVTAVGIDSDGNSKIFFNNVLTNKDGLTISVTANSSAIDSFGFNSGTGRLLDQSGLFIDGPVNIVLSNGASTTLVVNDLGTINEK